MSEGISIREKTTEPVVMQVLADGIIVDLTGIHHVELHMINSKGRVYRYSSLDTVPQVAVSNAMSGLVAFTPPDETIFKYTCSPYKLYIKIFDTATEHYTVPESGAENEIEVRKEF